MKRISDCPTRPFCPPEDVSARIDAIHRNPIFRRLATARARLGLSMAAMMGALYFAYILTVALRPAALGTPVWPGAVSTWGVVAGVGLLSMGFVLTAIYVGVANRHFDHLTKSLEEDVR